MKAEATEESKDPAGLQGSGFPSTFKVFQDFSSQIRHFSLLREGKRQVVLNHECGLKQEEGATLELFPANVQ